MKDENMKLMNEYFVNWKNRICFSFLVLCTPPYTPLFCPTVGWLVGPSLFWAAAPEGRCPEGHGNFQTFVHLPSFCNICTHIFVKLQQTLKMQKAYFLCAYCDEICIVASRGSK